MKLQTQIPVSKVDNPIDYNGQMLLLGSCFSENIGCKLEYFQFKSVQNPFGISFHPKAIESMVERALQGEPYSEADIFYENERWQSFDTHSELSNNSKENLLINLNASLQRVRLRSEKSTHIVLTPGTAWVYRHLNSGQIVANCHKVPQTEFSKELLPIKTIIKSLERTIELIQSVNKEVQIIFTVSPIRHLKDGFVENQRSKAHLISAIHHVLENYTPVDDRPGIDKVRVSYFPSYEIQMDELRDYRFYKSDMVHPNEIAIDYIWEKFKQVWIADEAYPTMSEVDTVQKGLRHRPFHPESKQHLKFRKSLDSKIAELQRNYPFMAFDQPRPIH